MYNLIIDQGNTRTKFYLFDQNYNIIQKKSCLNTPEQTSLLLVKEFLSFHPQYAIYSSVSGLNDRIINEIKHLKVFIIFDHKTPIPIENLYESKQTLGMDRLAGAIGANYIFPGKNLLIIDIGTAITYDFVTEKNQFLGGNISPGPMLRFRALNEFTANLPLVELDYPQRLIAQNTREAILNGVVHGIVAEIKGIIREGKTKFKDLKPILTGGYAYFFGKMFKNYIFVEANLVPIGLNCVLEFNKKLIL